MNQDDLNRCFLKALGLALLFMAIVAVPQALSGIIALFYWGWIFSGSVVWSGDAMESMTKSIAANQGLQGIKGFLSVLVMGWFSIQVLKEKAWVLRFTRITKAEPGTVGNEGHHSAD